MKETLRNYLPISCLPINTLYLFLSVMSSSVGPAVFIIIIIIITTFKHNFKKKKNKTKPLLISTII